MNIGGHILVFNSGSSSLKFQLFEPGENTPVSTLRGMVRGLADVAVCEWFYGGEWQHTSVAANDHGTAALHVLTLLTQISAAGSSLRDTVTAIGHRIVHGGESFFEPTLLTNGALAALDALSPLAPLHNPPALSVIRACQQELPHVPKIGVFDTSFFHELPDYARVYALPAEWARQELVIRRYGFHGLAHRYMVERYLAMHDQRVSSSKVITLQLGHGCSIAAVRNGHAIETSMGFTPLEGLIMATRPGDLDSGVLLHLIERGTLTTTELNNGLTHKAGLLGLSGVSADMRELLKLEAQGHSGAHLAVEAFCHRARKYIGAYLAVLNGADAIVFGGGIGEHAPEIRARICAGMDWCGLQLDEPSNRPAVGVEACISLSDASVAAYVIPVDEEILIARDVQYLVSAMQNQ